MTQTKRMLVPFLTCCTFWMASVTFGQTIETPKASGVAASETETITKILTAQTKAWNDGDLEKFMATYWRSEKLSFSSGGKTTFGWQGTLDNYKKGYAPPKEMGTLHFDGLQVSMIEAKSALVLGNWHLKFKDDSIREGNFSLVVKKLDTGWKIIHDHSSELKKKDDELSDETNTIEDVNKD